MRPLLASMRAFLVVGSWKGHDEHKIHKTIKRYEIAVRTMLDVST